MKLRWSKKHFYLRLSGRLLKQVIRYWNVEEKGLVGFPAPVGDTNVYIWKQGGWVPVSKELLVKNIAEKMKAL